MSGIRRARESFPIDPDCGYINGLGYIRCYHSLGAWRLQYTITKNGSSTDLNYDYVVVRYNHAVVAFHFYGGDYSVPDAQSLVEAVLSRVADYWWS